MTRNRALAVACGAIWRIATVWPGIAAGAESWPAASSLCQRGDALFRHADFDRAAAVYEAALAIDPGNARAHWGLGRIANLEFRHGAARDLFAAAFRLNPRDPDIIQAYVGFTTDSRDLSVLLRNLIAVTRDAEPDRAGGALAQLRVQERLGGERLNRLASSYGSYQIRLAAFHPAGSRADGLVIPTRINGRGPLRLVLDTGARGVVVHHKAARDLGLEVLSEARLEGLGAPVAAQSALARSVSFGELEFHDCLVEISEATLAPGVDGVLGTSLFADFQVRLDPGAQRMDLVPYPDVAGAAPPPAIPAYGLRGLLLVKARVNRQKDGLFLVDTGAAYTSVSREIGRLGAQRPSLVPLAGVTAIRTAPVELQVAGRSLVDANAVALDLDRISEQEGVEISGIIGYSLLGKVPLTLNYRDGLVQLGR